jgi:hydroxymethylpyrimidine/phosphomethylpyrimidine kinase
MKTALTIAGSDSGGGAGIQADLKTFAAHGVYGTSAVTAITAQNTIGVTAALPLPTDLIEAQLDAIASDIGVDAAKTGMLATAAIVEVVAAAVQRLAIPWLVVDPVMVAKSGDRLLDESAVGAITTVLLPRAFVVMPNRMEAEVLAGMSIDSLDDARTAARRIFELGPRAVIVKGGHLPTDEVVDLLFDGTRFHEFSGPRVVSRNTHGTGCTFAAAVTANLALGETLGEATDRAKRYVTGAIQHGIPLGRGHGPLNHFWQRS